MADQAEQVKNIKRLAKLLKDVLSLDQVDVAAILRGVDPEARATLLEDLDASADQVKALRAEKSANKNKEGRPNKAADEFIGFYARLKHSCTNNTRRTPKGGTPLLLYKFENEFNPIELGMVTKDVVEVLHQNRRACKVSDMVAVQNYIAYGKSWQDSYTWWKEARKEKLYRETWGTFVASVEVDDEANCVSYVWRLRSLYLLAQLYPRIQFADCSIHDLLKHLKRLMETIHSDPNEEKFWRDFDGQSSYEFCLFTEELDDKGAKVHMVNKPIKRGVTIAAADFETRAEAAGKYISGSVDGEEAEALEEEREALKALGDCEEKLELENSFHGEDEATEVERSSRAGSVSTNSSISRKLNGLAV